MRWCELHVPPRDGAQDATVNVDGFLSGSAEAGGEINRRWCELIHASGRHRFRPPERTP